MFLVTGATGHIGNVLVRQLIEKGNKVRAMLLPNDDTSALNGLDVEIVHGNVLDYASLINAMQGVDGMFHLAGMITIMPGPDPRVWDVNVHGAKNALHAALEMNLDRFVYTSSIHALKRVDDGVIDESVPYDPDNPYGTYDRAKATATQYILDNLSSKMDTILACPTGVIGPYDYRKSLMGDSIRNVANNQTSIYFEGAYDFVDVRDVADGLIAAYEKGKHGESYILSGERVTMEDIYDLVQQALGEVRNKVKLPLFLAEFFSKITPLYYRLTKTTPQLTPYSVEVLQSNANISHAKATRELGYEPRSVLEAIRDALEWEKANAAG